VLRKAFLEAKWLYNWLVSDTERLSIPANKVSAVEVKAGDSYEQRELTVLGSQIKQEIADRLKDNLLALGKLKKNGRKVGALKCKRTASKSKGLHALFKEKSSFLYSSLVWSIIKGEIPIMNKASAVPKSPPNNTNMGTDFVRRIKTWTATARPMAVRKL